MKTEQSAEMQLEKIMIYIKSTMLQRPVTTISSELMKNMRLEGAPDAASVINLLSKLEDKNEK